MCIFCTLAGKSSGGPDCSDASAAAAGEDGTGSAKTPAGSTDVVETADASAGAGTSYSIGTGLSASGSIASLGDSDWYRIDLVAGHTYTFAVAGIGATSNSLDDPYLRLRSSGGVELAANDDSGPGGYSSLTFAATTTGTYYLDVQAWNNASTGQYAVSAIEGTRASYDLAMGAGALLVPNLSWSGSPGTVATVTWGFRQTTNNNAPNFSQLSAAKCRRSNHTAVWSDVAGVTFPRSIGRLYQQRDYSVRELLLHDRRSERVRLLSGIDRQ